MDSRFANYNRGQADSNSSPRAASLAQVDQFLSLENLKRLSTSRSTPEQTARRRTLAAGTPLLDANSPTSISSAAKCSPFSSPLTTPETIPELISTSRPTQGHSPNLSNFSFTLTGTGHDEPFRTTSKPRVTKTHSPRLPNISLSSDPTHQKDPLQPSQESTPAQAPSRVLSSFSLTALQGEHPNPFQFTSSSKSIPIRRHNISGPSLAAQSIFTPLPIVDPPTVEGCSPVMVREQEPARVPFSQTKTNVIQGNPQIPRKDSLQSGTQKPSNLNATNEPEFGKPSILGTSNQHPVKIPLATDVTSSGNVTRVKKTQEDEFSHLFIPSKPHGSRVEHRRPQASQNPLQELIQKPTEEGKITSLHSQREQPDLARNVFGSYQPASFPATATSNPTDDDVVEIPRPATFQILAPARQTGPPMFSSDTFSNPFYRNQNILDLSTSNIHNGASPDLFHDSFGASDPYTYIDSAKANEQIKELLEGAIEDEDDRPRTRRRKEELETKPDDVVQKLKGLAVHSTEANDVEEEADEDDGSVEGLKVKLLPHQIDGVAWMKDRELGTKKIRGVIPKGGILADDMGLGKTIQSIALILLNPKKLAAPVEEAKYSKDKPKQKPIPSADKGTLVVAPLALIKQWEGELSNRVEYTHRLKVCVHHGPQRAKSYKELQKFDVVITTYHTLVSEHGRSAEDLNAGCFGVKWHRIILDEAHSIKNRNAKATKAACDLNAEYRWCLTGTPMQNNLDELQSLINFLRIKPYNDLSLWRDQITRPMQNGRGGLAIRRLQVYLKIFMKRRTKDILKQEGALTSGTGMKESNENSTGFKIVKRKVEKVETDFSPDERAFYQRLESRADKSLEKMMAGRSISYASALVLLLRLRQACNHPQLVKGDLAKERDDFANNTGSQTPRRRKAATADDLDAIADMLGGLSVETKRCDICQAELCAKESSRGATRCTECEADLEVQHLNSKVKRDKKSKKAEGQTRKDKTTDLSKRSEHNRKTIVDSDDEEDSGGEDAPSSHQSRREAFDLAAGGTVSQNEDEDEEESTSGSSDSEKHEEDETSNDDDAGLSGDLMISTKIRHLLSILKADSSKHKYIVFSFFTSMLDLIEPYLRRDGIVYTRYDGQMKNDLREASLDRLRNHNKTRVLLCSLRAGSLGLNLTAASRVVILEPFWNPFVEEQAIDRVHRLNQTQDVVVYKMTIKDTVEARILDLQERKRELANATIEGKTAAAKLTLQDMLKLFRHDAEHSHGVDGIGLGGVKLLRNDRSHSTINESNSRNGREGSGGPQKPKRKEHEIYGRRW